MANTLYDDARRLWALGDIDWENDNFNCILVGSAYSYSADHKFLTAIDGSPGGPRDFGEQGPSGVVLTGRGVQTNGAIFADNPRFTVVGAERPQVRAVVIYRNVDGNDANANLGYFADTATGVPITPNGGDIIVTWSTGTNRILRL